MKQIYIVSKHPLFGEGIEEMLRQNAPVELLGRETDLSRAVQQIAALCPDVVIFDCHDENVDRLSALQHIFPKGAKTRIIEIDLDTNTLFIYTREQRFVERWQDLVVAIE